MYRIIFYCNLHFYNKKILIETNLPYFVKCYIVIDRATLLISNICNNNIKFSNNLANYFINIRPDICDLMH